MKQAAIDFSLPPEGSVTMTPHNQYVGVVLFDGLAQGIPGIALYDICMETDDLQHESPTTQMSGRRGRESLGGNARGQEGRRDSTDLLLHSSLALSMTSTAVFFKSASTVGKISPPMPVKQAHGKIRRMR